VDLDKDMSNAIEERIAQNGLLMDFRSYYHTKDTASTSEKAIKSSVSVADALSVYAVIRNSGTINKWNGDDTKFITGSTVAPDYKATDAIQPVKWQLQVGTDYFPKDQIVNFTQARAELDKALAHFGNIQRGNTSFRDFCNEKYVIGVNLENDPVSNYTGRTTKDNNIELNLNDLSVAAGADAWTKQIDMFILYTRVIKVLPDKVVNVYK
jgi:hypothetical protein